MTTYDEMPDNPGLLPYRVRQLESFRRALEDWKNGREGIDAWREVTDERMNAMLLEMKTIKKMLWGLIFTSVAGFGSVALAVYLSTGGGHP